MIPTDAPARTSGPSGGGGFTQIEVLVAILIVGLAAAFTIGGVINGLAQGKRAQDWGSATAWAQGEVDFLRQQCFTGLRPSSRKVTPATVRAGELPPPAGFAAGSVTLDAAGPALLRATVSLYRHDWMGVTPPESPVLTTLTYVSDIRIPGLCP